MNNGIAKSSEINNREKSQIFTIISSYLIDVFLKSLPIATVTLSIFTYYILLGYTSTYSIPFPFTFIPNMIMLSAVIALPLILTAVLCILPIYMGLFASQESYRLMKWASEGGLVRFRLFSKVLRQFFNIFTPLITCYILIIVRILFPDTREFFLNFTLITILFIFLIQAWLLLQMFYFKKDRKNIIERHSTNKKDDLCSSVFYIYAFNIFSIFWLIAMFFTLIKVPAIANYDTNNPNIVVALMFLCLLFIQFAMFYIGVRAGWRGILVLAFIFMLILLFIYPGGISFMTGALRAHNLGGGIVATLFIKGNACQHLDDVVETTDGVGSEAVCTTKPIAILLDVGGTIHFKRLSRVVAATEANEQQIPSDEQDNQLKSDGETVWSIDKNFITGMKFYSRGKPELLVFPDLNSDSS